MAYWRNHRQSAGNRRQRSDAQEKTCESGFGAFQQAGTTALLFAHFTASLEMLAPFIFKQGRGLPAFTGKGNLHEIWLSL